MLKCALLCARQPHTVSYQGCLLLGVFEQPFEMYLLNWTLLTRKVGCHRCDFHIISSCNRLNNETRFYLLCPDLAKICPQLPKFSDNSTCKPPCVNLPSINIVLRHRAFDTVLYLYNHIHLMRWTLSSNLIVTNTILTVGRFHTSRLVQGLCI